jgi:PAS domain-containing protein
VIENGIPALLGHLSHDLIFVCDRQFVVSEANPLAKQMLGTHIVGQPFREILSTMTPAKNEAFLHHLQSVSAGNISESWELLFHVAEGEPVLLHVRGGMTEQGEWLLVGTYESPQSQALYHEVLAMNSELTNLICQLNKEHARLSSKLSELVETQEYTHE